MIVLGMMSTAGQPLSELRRPFDRYAASGEINTHVDDAAATIERLSKHYADAKQDRLDGLTIVFDDWWLSVRSSNTEPVLRLNLEASTAEDCGRHVAEVTALFKAS